MIVQTTNSLRLPVVLPWYIAREPLPESFFEWAKSEPAPTRLRSIVGPPGSGKTTFLEELAGVLRREGLLVIELDLTEVTQQPVLWLVRELEELEGLGYVVWTTGRPENLEGEEFRRLWLVLIRALRHQPVVLLIDGFDEITARNRQWVESDVLVPFLFRSGEHANCRAIIARRDEYALVIGSLRWEDEVHPLQGLRGDMRAEQMRVRLETAGSSPDRARDILEWPDAPAGAIALVVALNKEERAALVDALAPFLTSNPFVNLLMLQQQLQHPDRPLVAADHRACLEAYVRRARLADMSTDDLVALIHRVKDPTSFRLTDLSEKQGHVEVRERVKGLIDAGMVSQIPGTARYRFDPAVIRLVRQSEGLDVGDLTS